MSLRDAFEKMGLRVTTPAESAPVPAEPIEVPADRDFPLAVLEQGALWVSLFGSKGAALAVLSRQLPHGRGYGRARAQDALRGAVERRLDNLPSGEGAEIRRKVGGSVLLTTSKAQTFDDEITDIAEALSSGAVETHLASEKATAAEMSTVTWPDMESGEDQYDYRRRLDSWAAGYTPAQLRAMGFDSYDIARRAIEARKAAELAAEVTASKAAIAAFEASGDFATLQNVRLREADGSGIDARTIAGASRWAWELVRTGQLYPSSPSVAPSPEWLGSLTQADFAFVLRCALQAPESFRAAFHATLIRLLGEQAPRVGEAVLPYGGQDSSHAVTTDGVVACSYWRRLSRRETRPEVWDTWARAQYAPVRLPTVPSSQGWVTVTTKATATVYGPESFRALESAHTRSGVGVDLRAWLGAWGRHPQKGFGRFYFEAVAGAASRGSCMVSVDDRTAEQVDLLCWLPDPAEHPFPATAWRLPVALTPAKPDQAHRSAHLVWTRNPTMGCAVRYTAHLTSCSRRDIGTIVSAQPSSTCRWLSAIGSSRKHDDSLVVALLAPGQELHLKDGRAVRYSDAGPVEVPGGAPHQRPE